MVRTVAKDFARFPRFLLPFLLTQSLKGMNSAKGLSRFYRYYYGIVYLLEVYFIEVPLRRVFVGMPFFEREWSRLGLTDDDRGH